MTNSWEANNWQAEQSAEQTTSNREWNDERGQQSGYNGIKHWKKKSYEKCGFDMTRQEYRISLISSAHCTSILTDTDLHQRNSGSVISKTSPLIPHTLGLALQSHRIATMQIIYITYNWQQLLLLQPFNGLLSKTTWVSRYQKGKTNLDFTGARDSEWQWHQLGHMQLCTSLQTDNHVSTPPHSFYRPDALPAAQPTASKHWRHVINSTMSRH